MSSCDFYQKDCIFDILSTNAVWLTIPLIYRKMSLWQDGRRLFVGGCGGLMAGGNSLGGRSFGEVFSACLSLGLVFWWVTSGHAADWIAVDTYVSGRSLHQLCLRMATGAMLLVASVGPFLRWTGKMRAAIGVSVAVLSTGIYLCSGFLGVAGLVLSGILAGCAFALFWVAWLEIHATDLDALFAMLLLALTFGGILGSGIAYYDKPIYCAASLLLPAGAWLLLARSPQWAAPDGKEERGLAATACGRSSFVLQVVSLLLCNVAGGPASYGALISAGKEAQSAPLVPLVLVVVLVLCIQPRKEVLFSCLSVGILMCIAPLLVFQDPPGWIAGLMSAGFWTVLMYSVAWFAAEGRRPGGGVSPMGLRGVAAVYLLSSLSELVGAALPGDTAYVSALVMVGIALAVALVDATRLTSQVYDDGRAGRVKAAEAEAHAPANPALALVSERFSLTEGERGVLEWLSRGYSLKQVAKELGITEGAAKYQRHNVYQKVGVSSRQELINLVEDIAKQNGLAKTFNV